jgi:hypothetical protein
VVRRQLEDLRRSLRGLRREGFRHVFVLSSLEDIEQVTVERQPMWNNRRDNHGPFDVIGDIHGCRSELQALLAKLRRLTPRSFEGPIVAAACILIVWSSTVPTQYRTLGPALGGDGRALRTYWDSAGFGHDDFETKDNLALVDYLKAQTLPCDKVFIWGYEPGVYFLAQRRPVSRFVYNFPMFTAYYRQSYRDELMADLGRETPAVFVVQHEDRTPHVSVHNHDSAEVLEQFDALKSFVTANYRLRDKVGRFDVYFRRDIDPDAARACLAANPLAPAPRPR